MHRLPVENLAPLLLLLSLASAPVKAQLAPSNDDLWDVNNGNQVTNSSALFNGVDPGDMFGSANGSPEAGNLLFVDNEASGHVHSIEWRTPDSHWISSFVLHAAHDGGGRDANSRGFSEFRLYTRNPDSGAFDILLAQYSTGNPYSAGPQPGNGVAQFNEVGNDMLLCMNFAPVRAREFRAEFVQKGPGGTGADGPRIHELDGYSDSPCPTLKINSGLNDAWFNANTAGQGFFIIVFEDTGIIFLAWFTYDTALPPDDVEAFLGAAGHRWLTAQGPYDGDTATLDVFLTEGGIFDMADPEPVTGAEPIGTITIKWIDCENGVLSYDIDPPGVSGEIPIRRIVPDNVALCEMLNPE